MAVGKCDRADCSHVPVARYVPDTCPCNNCTHIFPQAGQLGENGGGFQRSVGESLAMSDTVQFRLHVRGSSFLITYTFMNSFTSCMYR